MGTDRTRGSIVMGTGRLSRAGAVLRIRCTSVGSGGSCGSGGGFDCPAAVEGAGAGADVDTVGTGLGLDVLGGGGSRTGRFPSAMRVRRGGGGVADRLGGIGGGGASSADVLVCTGAVEGLDVMGTGGTSGNGFEGVLSRRCREGET